MNNHACISIEGRAHFVSADEAGNLVLRDYKTGEVKMTVESSELNILRNALNRIIFDHHRNNFEDENAMLTAQVNLYKHKLNVIKGITKSI